MMASNKIATEPENVIEAVPKRQVETKIPKPSFCTWKKKKSSILHRNNKSDFEEHTKSGLHIKFAHKIRMRSKNQERTLHKLAPVDDSREHLVIAGEKNGADSNPIVCASYNVGKKETVFGTNDTEKMNSGVAENSDIGSELESNDECRCHLVIADIGNTENVGDAKPADLKHFIEVSADRGNGGDSFTCDLKSKDVSCVNLVIEETIDDCSECPGNVFERNSVSDADEHPVKHFELKTVCDVSGNPYKYSDCKPIDNDDFKNLDNVGEKNSVSELKIAYEGSENCDNGSEDKTISSADLNTFVEYSGVNNENAGKHLD